MPIFSDAKADQYVYDENYDYINNKDKKTIVEPKVPVKPHEMFEVSPYNVYGPFNVLFMKLIEDIKKQAKLDKFDETKYDEATYKAFFDTFAEKSLALLQTNFDVFNNGNCAKVDPDPNINPFMPWIKNAD